MYFVDRSGIVKRWSIVKISCMLMFSTLFFLLSYTYAQAENAVDRWTNEKVAAGVVEPPALYIFGLNDGDRFWHLEQDFRAGILFASLGDLLLTVVDGLSRETLRGLSDAELKRIAFENNITYYVTDISALSEQVWAVSMDTEPGGQGQLNQNIEAVCGSHSGVAASGDENGDDQHEVLDAWWFVDRQVQLLNNPARRADLDNLNGGHEFVGDYFTIEQFVSTSGGLTRQYISISSPWLSGFVHEDVRVAGRAVVRDQFMMNSPEPGQAWVFDWQDLF